MKNYLATGALICKKRMPNPFIIPDWPAPDNIKAFSTTRSGGVSLLPYDTLNLSDHVGDHPDLVDKNRRYITKIAALPENPRWLKQMHGTHVIDSNHWQKKSEADAIISQAINHVCVIMTADCLPILLYHQRNNAIAAIHAGWRGIAAGIIEKTVARFSGKPQHIMAWLGPAIGPARFEVGTDVYDAFYQYSAKSSLAFKQKSVDSYLADIYLLAKQRLHRVGISAVFGGNFCTLTEKQRFFSYRRDGQTGRMATMIWNTGK